MVNRNQLRRELGSEYQFCRLLSDRELRRLQKQNPLDVPMQPVAILTAGCVKIEVTLYRSAGKLQLGYDVFVKDAPNSTEWVCYDSPTDPVKIREQEMLSVLDRVVEQNGLSYTECRFPTLQGKQFKSGNLTP